MRVIIFFMLNVLSAVKDTNYCLGHIFFKKQKKGAYVSTSTFQVSFIKYYCFINLEIADLLALS